MSQSSENSANATMHHLGDSTSREYFAMMVVSAGQDCHCVGEGGSSERSVTASEPTQHYNGVMQASQVFQEKYRIEREIGRGSFGVVYLAQEIETFAWRAIKVLLPWARGMPAMKHRLKREAKLTRMLQSPNAVRIHDTGETHEG